jgi:hypothetical protein
LWSVSNRLENRGHNAFHHHVGDEVSDQGSPRKTGIRLCSSARRRLAQFHEEGPSMNELQKSRTKRPVHPSLRLDVSLGQSPRFARKAQ